MTAIEKLFSDYFPKLASSFSLKPIQTRTIDNILKGNNSLCIMPTGGGKSLIYWISGMANAGITIVVSPLIALIDEQAQKLEEQGCSVLTFHTGQTSQTQIDQLTKIYNHEITPNFIIVSPERLATDGFFEYCINARKNEIKLFVVDEVHCVSQWGVTFRPFYKRIPQFLNNLYGDKWLPRILALTATINPKEIIDICTEFKIEYSNIVRDDLLIRNEIRIKVFKLDSEEKKEEKLWELLQLHKNEKSIIYLYRKYNDRGTEGLATAAIERGYNAAYFHADLTAKERQKIIDDFKNNKINLLFATNAFGMGIDIPDIRLVIHFMIPESIEQYYQEIGRAARDGGQANAYLLYTDKNIEIKKEYFIDRSFPSAELLQNTYKKITQNKQGLKTIKYYDDDDVQKCLQYYLDFSLLKICGKGFSNLTCLDDIHNESLKELYDLTITKGILTTIKKSSVSPESIINLTYSCLANDNVKLIKPFDKCLIAECLAASTHDVESTIISSINDKKAYKHNLLDYFIYILSVCSDSIQLHQEIGKYLGVEKHKLNLIYSTLKGDRVRSKSEVIIANMLFEENINYEYEKKLFYNEEKTSWLEPDFTIKLKNNEEIYWEHLGMLGVESYDQRWLYKKKIYESKYPGRLVITYESCNLSDEIHRIITKL